MPNSDGPIDLRTVRTEMRQGHRPISDDEIDFGAAGAGTRQVHRLSTWLPSPHGASRIVRPEFSLVEEEVQNRLYQVYNGPVGEEISRLQGEEKFRDIGRAAYAASLAIHESNADGPVDLALNESNVRGMLTWALDEAGLKQEDRQALIKTMEDMGVGSPVTAGPVGSVRSGEGQFEEGLGHSTTRGDGVALSRGYEPRERGRSAR